MGYLESLFIISVQREKLILKSKQQIQYQIQNLLTNRLKKNKKHTQLGQLFNVKSLVV